MQRRTLRDFLGIIIGLVAGSVVGYLILWHCGFFN